MWGIIPAAGIGSRIQPLAFSKELLPVGSRIDGATERPRAVSEYLIERMVRGGASKICFVIGDSAPYGVHVPAVPWLGALALSAGFKSCRFEKTRDRNVKWKNRKHRVPLLEGHLWIEG